jgi:hypothetical protein
VFFGINIAYIWYIKQYYMKKLLLVMVVAAATVATSCEKKDTPNTTSVDCATTPAKFSADAAPIIATRCASSPGCHGTGSSNSGGVLVSYTQINAKKIAIRASILNGSMPQGSSLTDAQKKAIVCWIDAGALNN